MDQIIHPLHPDQGHNHQLPSVAWFVSPHGYGHAARSCAIMEALHAMQPGLHFEIFSSAPAWFFQHSLHAPYRLHHEVVDLGLVQRTPLEEDLPATLQRLDDLIPFNPLLVSRLAEQVRGLGCSLVMCDIAPLGIMVASRAGVPSVLFENFTWDWIYQAYEQMEPGFGPIIAYLEGVFARADWHIQSEPVCNPSPMANLHLPPVSRSPHRTRKQVRRLLSVPNDRKMVLLAISGSAHSATYFEQLPSTPGLFFAVLGSADETFTRGDDRILIPRGSYSPDLVNASDALIAKTGYSSLAEAYMAGIPVIYIGRQHFRESPVIGAYIEQHLGGFEIEEVQLTRQTAWQAALAQLLDSHVRQPHAETAREAAKFILTKITA